MNAVFIIIISATTLIIMSNTIIPQIGQILKLTNLRIL